MVAISLIPQRHTCGWTPLLKRLRGSQARIRSSGGQLFVLGVEIGHGPRLLAALGNPDVLSMFVTDRALLFTRILMHVDRTIFTSEGRLVGHGLGADITGSGITDTDRHKVVSMTTFVFLFLVLLCSVTAAQPREDTAFTFLVLLFFLFLCDLCLFLC